MSSETETRKLVVASLICNADGDVLLTKRPVGKSWAGYWEFPGGKMEQGEHPTDALVRELSEELGVKATVERIFDVVSYCYPDVMILMLVYVCSIQGIPQPLEVEEIRFVPRAQLREYQVLPADEPIIRRLCLES